MNPRFDAMLGGTRSCFIRRRRRAVAARAASMCLMAAAGLSCSSSALALAKSDMSFPHAMTPSFRWSEPVEMQLSGLPVVVRGFVAASTLEQAARAMARHEKHFQRVTTLPGSILLSGVHQGRHWVAQLEAGPGQVKGMVSALPLDLAPPSSKRQSGVLEPWLTQNARYVFGQSSSVHGRAVVHSMHLPNGPLEDFVGALDQRLSQAGWRRSGAHSWVERVPGKQAGAARIDVFPARAPSGQGDAVLVSQSH